SGPYFGCLTVIRPHAALIHNNDCGITPVEPESILPKKHLKIRYLQRQTHIRSYSLDCAHNPSQPDKATSQARYRPTLFGGHGLGGLSKFGETDGCPCLWAGMTAVLCLIQP